MNEDREAFRARVLEWLEENPEGDLDSAVDRGEFGEPIAVKPLMEELARDLSEFYALTDLVDMPIGSTLRKGNLVARKNALDNP